MKITKLKNKPYYLTQVKSAINCAQDLYFVGTTRMNAINNALAHIFAPTYPYPCDICGGPRDCEARICNKHNIK